MNLWEDARVIRGMRAQLELRRKRLAAGDAPLGWKVGFAAPAMLERRTVGGILDAQCPRSIGRKRVACRLGQARGRA